MAWTRTVAQLRADARARADMETDDGEDEFVTDSMILTWINLAITELIETIVAEAEDLTGTPGTGITVSATASTSADVDLYDLATDVFKLVGVDISNDGGTNWVNCERFPFAERNSDRVYRSRGMRYALVGDQIMFRPVPTGAVSFRYWYIPTFVPLTDVDGEGSASFDFIHGWDDWVACRVAIRCLQKQEDDTLGLERDLSQIRQRILAGCKVRDQGEPTTWADTRGMLPRSFDDEDWT